MQHFETTAALLYNTANVKNTFYCYYGTSYREIFIVRLENRLSLEGLQILSFPRFCSTAMHSVVCRRICLSFKNSHCVCMCVQRVCETAEARILKALEA